MESSVLRSAIGLEFWPRDRIIVIENVDVVYTTIFRRFAPWNQPNIGGESRATTSLFPYLPRLARAVKSRTPKSCRIGLYFSPLKSKYTPHVVHGIARVCTLINLRFFIIDTRHCCPLRENVKVVFFGDIFHRVCVYKNVDDKNKLPSRETFCSCIAISHKNGLVSCQ